ncbi:MAG: glycosyltransferase, partial [Bacteroidales bacterium]|nr:glycosyltransferase [Bacteroidales bacterium]
MKVKYGYGFVFDMRGFYADERVDGALWNLKNPLYKWIFQYFKNKEKQFLTKADYIVSLTENAKNEIHSWKYLQGQPLPIEVIPCCADMRHFNIANIDFIKQKELIKLLKLEQIDIILSYLGSFGTWYLPIEMFTFFKRMLAVCPKSKFLILSPDAEEDIIKIADSCGLSKDYLIIKYAKRSEVPLYLSLSNLSIFFIKPTFSKKASSPTKQGETMALGIPVITNAGIGDTDMILNTTSTGYVINDFNDSNYEKAVLAIDSLLKIPKEQIIEAANKFYSLEKGIEKYNSIYNKVK